MRIWARRYREECANSPSANEELDTLAEIRRLKKELEEVKKENQFLKKPLHSSQRNPIRSISIYRAASQ